MGRLLLLVASYLLIAGSLFSPAKAAVINLATFGTFFENRLYTDGFEFTVKVPFTVTALGIFDKGADGLGGPAQVGIWDASQNLLTSVTVPTGTGGTLDNYFRFASITPYLLTPGTVYIIGAYQGSDDATSIFAQGGTGTVDPNVTIIEDRYRSSSSLVFPDTSDGYAGGAWLGANFQGTAATPVPAALPLFATGLGGLGFMGWWRRKTARSPRLAKSAS